MGRLGYYAKDKNGNLHQFEWGSDDTFYIINGRNRSESTKVVEADPNDYEILEIGFFTSDDYD